MAIEIERAFIVRNNMWIHSRTDDSRILSYGYIEAPHASICVRHIISSKGAEGRINIKSRGSKLNRVEHEIRFDPLMAKEMIDLHCQNRLVKVRHFVDRWEIDEFLGEHLGLVLAEIELSSADEGFHVPDWVGAEVTEDPKYSSEMIAKNGVPGV